MRQPRLLLVALVAVLLGALVTTMVVRVLNGHHRETLAEQATVTASSTSPGYSERDVVSSASSTAPGAAWRSDGAGVGAWIQLAWSSEQEITQIIVVRNPLSEGGASAGFISFGDGSHLQVQLSSKERQTVIPITPRRSSKLRFTATRTAPDASALVIAEIVLSGRADDGVRNDGVADGNASSTAAVTTSRGASDGRSLQDGSGAAGATGAGVSWTAVQPVGAWVQLDWPEPRELSSIALLGSEASAARLTRATLLFDDGTKLAVGAVTADAKRPTIIGFMPRVARAVRLTIDSVSGSGPLLLAEFRAYQRGFTPVRSPTGDGVERRVPDEWICPPSTAGAPVGGIAVECPRSSSAVTSETLFRVKAATTYDRVTATVWPADGDVAPAEPVSAQLDSFGVVELSLDLSATPEGPLTLRFEAEGDGNSPASLFFQLYKSPIAEVSDVDSSPGAAGRTLVYGEEFNQDISLSFNGDGADYAAAKPTAVGAEDFGEAIFPDPARQIDNVGVVDNRYLRIGVEPKPASLEDPRGRGREHVGGLLASSRQGGSGFSAQYGYFEARMLVPAAPGTWPAFWMLPSDDLISPTPVVAEIDAVELYGHDPQEVCHSTHQYKNGEDSRVARCGETFDSARRALSWHTWGVSITPTEVVFYLDGKITATAPQVEGGGAPMFFLVNLALGGGWPVQLEGVQHRAALYVDYVRVYV